MTSSFSRTVLDKITSLRRASVTSSLVWAVRPWYSSSTGLEPMQVTRPPSTASTAFVEVSTVKPRVSMRSSEIIDCSAPVSGYAEQILGVTFGLALPKGLKATFSILGVGQLSKGTLARKLRGARTVWTLGAGLSGPWPLHGQ